MKTSNIFFGIAAITLASLQINAQSHPNKTYWIISKDVQKVSNGSWLQDQNSLAVQSVGIAQGVISKSVNHLMKASPTHVADSKGNMISDGYPAWTISKGIARIK